MASTLAITFGLQPTVALAVGPAVSGFSPTGGVVGALVSLTGSNFTGATALAFNGTGANFSVTSATTITTSVPFGATTGHIAVTTMGGTASSSQSFKVKPKITSLGENSAPAGAREILTGSAFTGATAVTFNGTAASFTADSYSEISAIVPVGAGSGSIKVTTAGGSATSLSSFTVIPPATLVVDADRALGSISKGLFSSNHRYNDAGTGVLDLSTVSSNPTILPIRSDVLAWAKQFGITGLRFPGGTESDQYNWYAGIGPILSRPTCPTQAGPPNVCNAYGIMEHMAFVEALGPDAVQWTGITLARQIRAVDAANFVEFVNAPNDGAHPWAALRALYGHPQPYGVHYWAIGNEVTAVATFYPNVNYWLDGYTVNGVRVWDGAIAIRDAMKAVDPTIWVGTGWIPKGTDLYAALQARHTRFDFADVHGGLVGSGPTAFNQHYTGINAATHIADIALTNQQLINSAQFPSVNGMQVVSWENDAAPTIPLRYSLSHALANAVSLTTLIADGIVFDSHSPFSSLVTLPPTAGARAEDIQWSPSSPPDSSGNQYINWYATAPSYTYELFANDLGTESVATTLTGDPSVTVNKVAVANLYATAALDAQGDVLGVIVTNADYADAWPVAITLRGFNTALGSVERVSGADVTTVDTQSAPSGVSITAQTGVTVPAEGSFSYTFPAHSITAIDFRRIPSPTVFGVAPAQGPQSGGTTVVVSGSGLSGASAVTFGATPAAGYSVDSDTQITATSPAGSGAVDVTVTTAAGTSPTSAADQFTYLALPAVLGVAPAQGPEDGGTTVVVSGSGFTGAGAVTFGATAATSYSVGSDTQITATSPAGSGAVDVTVTTATGTSATSAADQFTYLTMPAILGLSPAHGPEDGGTTVVVSGSSFSGAGAVTFGTTAATSYSVDSDTQITATSPAGSGTVDVTVSTTAGTSATSPADQFAYLGSTLRRSTESSRGPFPLLL